MVRHFISDAPKLEDYWRSIVLFGRNVASYKFALAASLLEINPTSGQLVKISDLAPIFAKHITKHLKSADKQGTSGSSRFLDACRKYNLNELTHTELMEHSVRFGFNNVIDAFHIVGQSEIAKRFFIDERDNNKGIRITDAFNELLENRQATSLPSEVEARWRLVETAWELGISRHLLSINYDSETEILFSIDNQKRRKSITGSRDALNGYQKGKCFYCFTDIYVNGDGNPPDVDHFFPHRLKYAEFGLNFDGVWNLVLSCQDCNRGSGGKFDQIPSLRLLERLHRRNEFLIDSHHPLRETLIRQSGMTDNNRIAFLNDVHKRAWATIPSLWESKEKHEPAF